LKLGVITLQNAPWAELVERWQRLVELFADDYLHPKRDIPLTIAGRGPTILRLAAQYADRWNTFGGFGKAPDEALAQARADIARLDELCTGTGRTVTRSVMLGYPFIAQTLWDSDEHFAEVVERWAGAGFEELVVYYPPEWGMPEGSVTPGVFERAVSKG
jgi:alkanesulfonate monooxygenase SsuD/methylene tetrahydromethanopterin reductase-like flavin-dependent oxidoreductase (luciferase family)